MDFQYNNFVYPGPLFPNNFAEFEDLENGSFYIVDTESEDYLKKIDLKIKSVVSLDIELKNALEATDQIISELDKKDLEDKIVLLRIRGELETGKTSDIKFLQIEEFVKVVVKYIILLQRSFQKKKINVINVVENFIKEMMIKKKLLEKD